MLNLLEMIHNTIQFKGYIAANVVLILLEVIVQNLPFVYQKLWQNVQYIDDVYNNKISGKHFHVRPDWLYLVTSFAVNKLCLWPYNEL